MSDAKPTMEAFFTREKANEGVKLPLHLPTGERTEHWIEIYGVDSDAFRTSDAIARREGIKIAQLPEGERDGATADLTRRLRAALVKGWSFPQECSPEAVASFLREAPQLGEAIDRMASNRQVFFGIASLGSSPTPSMSSDSTPSPKAARSHDEPASSKSPSQGTSHQT